MLNTKDITIGVVFTKRDFYIESFFIDLIMSDSELTKNLSFCIIDNCCDFSINQHVHKILKNYNYKIIRNEKIESLPYNHNLIYFNSDTDYVIHNNDECYLRKDWLKNLVQWYSENDGKNMFGSLCRASKFYHKDFIKDIGYFNMLLTGKDGSDTSTEFLAIKKLQFPDLTVNEFRNRNDFYVHPSIIGGYWRKEFVKEKNMEMYCAKLACQPFQPEINKGDSNDWLFKDHEKELSENNKSSGGDDYWNKIGKQIEEDVPNIFKDKNLNIIENRI